MAALYQELGERGNEMENSDYERKKADDLQKRLSDARSSIHHLEIVRISHGFSSFLYANMLYF